MPDETQSTQTQTASQSSAGAGAQSGASGGAAAGGTEPKPNFLSVFGDNKPEGTQQTSQQQTQGSQGGQQQQSQQGSTTQGATQGATAGAQPGAAQATTGQQQAAGQPGSAVPIQMDEQMLSRIVQMAAQKQGAQPETPLTEADVDKMFNVYKVAEPVLAQLGLEATPERVAVMNQILQGVAKQAQTVAAFQANYVRQQLEQQFAPVLQFIQQQRLSEMKSRFFVKHPNLTGYEPLLVRIKDSFVAQGRSFNNEDEAFKAVSEEAYTLLKGMGVDPDKQQTQQGQQQQANGQQQQTTTSQMTTLSGGGQGGAGDAGRGGASSQGPNWRKYHGASK